MMRIFLVYILAFLIEHSVHCQSNFQPGTVLSLNGDSLKGEIDSRGDLTMGSVCRFRENQNSKIVEYNPVDISGYFFPVSGKYYISKEYAGVKSFMEYLIKGKVSIYYLRDLKGDHYYIENEKLGMSELPYEEGIKINEEGKQYFYSSKKHIGILNYYMDDAAVELQPQIQAVKKPEHVDLINIAKNYHNLVCKDEKCIIYQKEFKVRWDLEIIAGIVRYFNSNGDGILPRVVPGVIFHVGIPRVNEKLYIRTGFFFPKFPLQLEYFPRKNIFSPRISLGLNSYFFIFYSLNVNVGFNIKITKRFDLTGNYDYESTVTFKPFAHSIYGGFAIKF